MALKIFFKDLQENALMLKGTESCCLRQSIN